MSYAAAMPASKAKRGLGLLVVAVLAFVVLNITVRVADSLITGGGLSEVAGWSFLLLSTLVGLTMFACMGVGLVMIAWGLLRD